MSTPGIDGQLDIFAELAGLTADQDASIGGAGEQM